jgi:hypothetical protein
MTTALAQGLAAFNVRHLDNGTVQVEMEHDMPRPELDLLVRRHHRWRCSSATSAPPRRGPDGAVSAAGDPAGPAPRR